MIDKERFNEYAFYQFIKDYHERDQWKNSLAGTPHLAEELIGVLDGQQRLNSMYVALQGTYTYKRKRLWRNNPDAYPVRRFYLNVFGVADSESDNDFLYDFRFLPDTEASKVDDSHCWYPVKQLLECEKVTDVSKQWTSFINENPGLAELSETHDSSLDDLVELWQRLTQVPLINFFPVHNQNLDEVLDIFVRVNSAGKPLSKTDLLFSTIVAHWEKGREEIEAFLEKLNARGNGFQFDNDFIMRACLVMADCPVRLRVASFKSENVKSIVGSWDEITKAIEQAVDLLVKWGFQGETLTASNAVIPIAYAIKSGCDVSASERDLQLFLIKALAISLFSNRGDQLLTTIRNYLRGTLSETTTFNVRDFEENAKLPPNKTLAVDREIVEELVSSEKGPRTFMLLSLLYTHLKFDQIHFHQDHIHSRSLFTKSKLAEFLRDKRRD